MLYSRRTTKDQCIVACVRVGYTEVDRVYIYAMDKYAKREVSGARNNFEHDFRNLNENNRERSEAHDFSDLFFFSYS